MYELLCYVCFGFELLLQFCYEFPGVFECIVLVLIFCINFVFLLVNSCLDEGLSCFRGDLVALIKFLRGSNISTGGQ